MRRKSAGSVIKAVTLTPIFDISDCGFMVRFDALKSALIIDVPQDVPRELTEIQQKIFKRKNKDSISDKNEQIG